MKLAMVCPREPWFPGGVQRVVGEIAARLRDTFEIEIVCCSPSDSSVGTREWNGLVVKVHKAYVHDYLWSPTLADGLRNLEADVIHLHGFTTFPALVAARANKSGSIVYNPHFHVRASNQVYQAVRIIYDRYVGESILRNVHLVVCNSYSELRALRHRLSFSTRTNVIYNGADVRAIREAQPHSKQGTVILYVGRLEAYKNVQSVIEALKYLPEEFTFIVIGQGPYGSELADLVRRRHLQGRVRFLGVVDDKEVYRYLKTSDVFVHLSDVESFGMTCIEALAAGTPVLANDDGFGLKETADMFPQDIRLIDASRTRAPSVAMEIGRLAGQKVNIDLQAFDWSAIAQQFAATYENCVDH